MENILEKIIELAEKIWLRLDIFLGLVDIEALSFLKPLLANILSDPLLFVLATAGFTILLFGIYKLKNSHTEKERRLDELLQELDAIEERDEVDLDRPLFQNITVEDSTNNESSTDIPRELEEKNPESAIYGDEFESPSSEKEIITTDSPNQPLQEIKNEDLNWESDHDEWNALYDTISVSQTPQEIIDDNFDWDSTLEEWDDLYESVSEESPKNDNSATTSLVENELEEAPEIIDAVEEKLEETAEELAEELEEAEFLEAASSLEKEPAETILEEEELKDDGEELEEAEFLKAVSNLEKEPGETILEEEELKDDGEELEEAEFLKAVSNLEKEPAETTLEEEEIERTTEELEEADFLEAISNLEKEPAETIIPKRIELSLEEIEPALEAEIAAETVTSSPSQPEQDTTKSSAGPLLESMLNSSVSAKTDALVSRLKTFQAELETRFSSLEIEQEVTNKTLGGDSLRKKQNKYQPASVSYKSKPKSRSNKEYLSQLESFIFVGKQRNQGTDT